MVRRSPSVVVRRSLGVVVRRSLGVVVRRSPSVVVRRCGGKAQFRAQELCESRGGRLGLPSLISLRFLWTKSNTHPSQSQFFLSRFSFD